MTEVTVGIIGAIAGIITGFVLAMIGACRSVDDAWIHAHEAGFHEGMEFERIRQENQRKENALFAKDAENDPPECVECIKAGR